MKVLTNEQIKYLDQQTLARQNISSEALMERAGTTFVHWLCSLYPHIEQPFCIYCGTGNNGGDGLVIGRLLIQKLYRVRFIICHLSNKQSLDFQLNLIKLNRIHDFTLAHLYSEDEPIFPVGNEVVIDAILGSGMNKPLDPFWQSFIHKINQVANPIVAVDIPTGMNSDDYTPYECLNAAHTMAFQVPKKAFFFSENYSRVGEWVLGHIGLDDTCLADLDSSTFTVDKDDLIAWLIHRSLFDHKGTYGHALIIAGSVGKVGAAILAAKSVLKSGAGLSTVLTPGPVVPIIQCALSEVMCLPGNHDSYLTQHFNHNLEGYDALGIGPGLGTESSTAIFLEHILTDYGHKKMVLDADALNIIALHKLHHLIPRGSILTPHPKEFERLFGSTKNSFERHELQKSMAKRYACIIILKGAFTCTAMPDGTAYFNMSGNPGMATAGSGDVLTGMITSLLAQGYSSEYAALIAVFLHGLAGDLAVIDKSLEALVAGDIIEYIGQAFKHMHSYGKTLSGSFYRRWNF